MDVGAKLKEARLEKGLSLDTLQETTKIQKRYLIAIEEGNLQILPGKFYARAFIKEYATAVGLDPNELLEEYKGDIPQSEEESVQYSRIQRTRKENNSEKGGSISSIIPKIIVVLLIVGILGVSFYFISQSMSGNEGAPVEEPEDNVVIRNPDNTGGSGNGNTEEDEDDAEDGNGETEDGEEDQNEEQSEPTFSVIEEGSGSQPVSTILLENAGDEIILELESGDTTQHTWLEIRSEAGEAYYNGSFDSSNSPMEIDISEAESVSFNIGYAPALNLSINGVEMEYPVDPTSYVHQKLQLNIE